MVLVSTKQESSSMSPLSIAPKEEKETTLSFSTLLKGLGTAKEDANNIQNGSLVLSLVKEEVSPKQALPADKLEGKKETLLSLVKNDIKEAKDEPAKVKSTQTQATKTSNDLPLELNPKITQSMTPSELKIVINQAKQYIKSKIINSEAFVKDEIKSLPKTLKGLAQVAKKIGLDVSKITLEQVQMQSKLSHIPTFALKKQIHISENLKTASQAEIKSDVHKEVKQDVKAEVKTEQKIDTAKRSTITEDIQTKTLKSIKHKIKTASQAEIKSDVYKDTKQQSFFLVHDKVEQKVDKKVSTPLFKAQTKTEITTQEIVNVQATNLEPKTAKQKTKNTLELLLHGDKIAKKDTNLTADFSVATARVIAPSGKTEASKNLESLLNNSDSDDSQTQSKTDIFQVHKADSFEVKLNEAKQMVKYLSSDIKNAIEDYKSPFTRIKVQLHPEKLGEVDLTIVQRGKNLHVNLSSNNAAINTLALNANDLKVQLNNNGINNASLNFSNNSQNSEQSTGSGAQQQNRQNAQNEYNYFGNEENKEEILSSLEIIVAHYV